MARDRKTRHTVVSSDCHIVGEAPRDSEEPLPTNTPCDPVLELFLAPQFQGSSSTVPSETAQEIWESLKEEFYEQIEQFPLSLHRFFALIGEQDKEVQAFQAELLPTIRSYVKLRLSIPTDATQDDPCRSQPLSPPKSPPDSPAVNSGVRSVNVHKSTEDTAQFAPESSVLQKPLEACGKAVNVSIQDVPSRASTHVTSCRSSSDPQSPAKSASQDIAILQRNGSSQSTPARTQGLRETDATVPKSVPFPPRPKPKTTHELLTRISFLMAESLRASEEKVGLATAAYDSVDRHVRVLDAAIREHEFAGGVKPPESSLSPGSGMQERSQAAANEGEDEDDEEPMLGMIGPTNGSEGRFVPPLRKNKKRDRRDQQKQSFGQHSSPIRIQTSATQHRDIPVDPLEPRYCFCNQVSYGEMIACDNADCPREWFHLGCAGLAAPPKGNLKWYCRDCEEALGRNRRRRVR